MSLPEPPGLLQAVNSSHISATCPHRARVIRQLLEAALFEGILQWRHDGSWFHFRAGELAYCARGKIASFGRVRLEQDELWRWQGVALQPVDLTSLVQALPGTALATAQLLQELQQTIVFCDWNQSHLNPARHRHELSYSELESAIHEGHPYHPCFKARTGFSFADHAQFGPEAGNSFQLHWLAVKRDYLASNLDCDSEQGFWQRELGKQTWQQLLQTMQKQGIDFLQYGLLPVHPWQFKNLQDSLQEPIEQRQILPLGYAGDTYQASISLRTLLNVSHPDKANIKLPLNVVNSSSLRVIEPHSVCTAPILSDWLAQIIAHDPWFEQYPVLAIQAEYAGIVLNDNVANDTDSAPWLAKLAPSLSVIFRDNHAIHQDHYSATPFVAMSLSEADGAAFITPWLQQFGVEAWVKRLIEVVVIPVWHLLVRHGIALETHGQNMTLLHDKGWPQKLVVKDFHESLEFVSDFLAAPQLQPDFAALHPDYVQAEPDRFYWMSSIEALRELLVDTLFVYNLADLSYLLQQQFDYPESSFWWQVDTALNHYAQTASDWSERLAQVDLTQEKIQTESLLRKKLSGQSQMEFHHTIPNPLHQIQGGA